MYIWQTGKLSEAIKNNQLTEKDWKQYFMAGGIMMTVLLYLTETYIRINLTYLFIELILMLVILVLGINIAFNTNQANNGSDFIARMTALSFPLTIKLLVVSILFGVSVGVLTVMEFTTSNMEELIISVFGVMIQVIFFWRINIHLKYINS